MRICKVILPTGVFCAGYKLGGKDTCQGDSGGPIVEKLEDIFILRGTTSYGRGCARKDFYGIYTDVGAYG